MRGDDVHFLGADADNVVTGKHRRRQVAAKAAARVEARGPGLALELPGGVVAEEDVLRAVPELRPRDPATRAALLDVVPHRQRRR